MAIYLFSPAKINLGLRIVGRDAKGYHLLESVFLPLDFGDELEITPSKSNKVTLEWAKEAPIQTELPSEENNIVTKLLDQMPMQWEVRIKKNIPLGAGLGGGSSNAGTLLKYFITQKILTTEKALPLAISLGADVPFFLNPLPSWVTGTGEKCEPLDYIDSTWRNVSVLLVLVPVHCDTKKVFSMYREKKVSFSTPTKMPTSSKELESVIQGARNDLQQTALDLFPTLNDVITTLGSTPCKFHSLSGSGSTCFALFKSHEECERIAKDLSNSLRKLGCKTVIARILQGGSQPVSHN